MKKLFAGISLLLAAACGSGEVDDLSLDEKLVKPDGAVRIATFNVSLYRDKEGQLVKDIMSGEDPQIQAIADIILKVNPDVLVLNEVDWNENYIPLGVLRDNYLSPPADETGFRPPSWPYIYMMPSNTGLNPGTVDFDNNGKVVTTPGSAAYASDSFGYGRFVGQYAMAVMSKYPLIYPFRRTFKQFKWKDMPENLMPMDYYSDGAQVIFRLSSKNHVDLPVRIGEEYIHLLMMHPTPPTFDGPEDRNGRRNHDEIRFFADYVTPGAADYIYDDVWLNGGKDKGRVGGIAEDARFVIIGDFNADPYDGASTNGAINLLLDHPAIVDPKPSSAGGRAAAAAQAGANDRQNGAHELDTADFRDSGNNAAGNLRIDYVLPSKQGLKVVGSGVYWPQPDEDGYELVGPGYPAVSSDHRLVWVDVLITD